MVAEVDLISRDVADTKVEFFITPLLWDNFVFKHFDIRIQSWTEIKFLDTDGNMNNQANDIPNHSGGIYVFFAKPGLIPNSHSYILYIGRARITANQNLSKRCKEYYSKYYNGKETRPKIKRMINTWGKYLYLKYLPLTDNEVIKELEDRLISAVIPPFNDEIPDATISNAVRAFR